MLNPLSKAAAGIAIAAACCSPVLLTARSQDAKSAPLAKELAQLLDASKVDSIAAPDPATGGFVAAIYVPGAQLLVVGGKFASPDIGTYRISKGEFRELYMDLTSGSEPASRVFASDISANGLVFKPAGDMPADTWQIGTATHAFAGAKKAKLKDAEYQKAFTEADEQYARILSLLISQAKPKSGS